MVEARVPSATWARLLGSRRRSSAGSLSSPLRSRVPPSEATTHGDPGGRGGGRLAGAEMKGRALLGVVGWLKRRQVHKPCRRVPTVEGSGSPGCARGSICVLSAQTPTLCCPHAAKASGGVTADQGGSAPPAWGSVGRTSDGSIEKVNFFIYLKPFSKSIFD